MREIVLLEIDTRKSNNYTFVQIGTHVQSTQRKINGRRDFRAVRQVMPETLQVDAQHFWQLKDPRIFHAIAQFLAFFTAKMEIMLQLIHCT